MAAYHQFRKLSKSVSIFRIAWTFKIFKTFQVQYYFNTMILVDTCATKSDVLFLAKLLHNRPYVYLHHIIYRTKYPYGDLKRSWERHLNSFQIPIVFGMFGDCTCLFGGKKGSTTIPRTCHKDPTSPPRSTVWHALQDCQLQPASLAEATCKDITDRPPTGSPPLNLLATSRD